MSFAALSNARLLAIMTPVVLLGGAIGSQYLGGLHPCEMCMWQRWPHLVAIFLALGAIAMRATPKVSAALTAFAALAIATSGGIGAFHAGVEYGWWQGITACSVAAVAGNAQDMLKAIMAAPLVRCDVAPWSLFGVSLAGYNALISLGAAGVIAALLSRSRRAGA
ncbi:MAG: disulfide bond formation protein B [Sphingobium sp.]